ncbi:hypothetical protein PG999_009356 [Apiospora kogelbergensis]|uniref:DUF202 domain-containing protein n=1 Tax=Apiospora kogelbergensis TaxID=1337665 RepID=A0AAW0QKI2_9PEZI
MQRVSRENRNVEHGTASRTSRCCAGALSASKLGKPVEYPRDLMYAYRLIGIVFQCPLLTSKSERARNSHIQTTTSRPSDSPFWSWPFLGPLLLDNESSDARDHCANERTFLSYLRLSIYMAIVSVAIVVSFHLRSQPTALELRIAKPLGIIFWILAFACLLGRYRTNRVDYPDCEPLVYKNGSSQTVVITLTSSQQVMSLVALSIIGTCVILLVIARVQVD